MRMVLATVATAAALVASAAPAHAVAVVPCEGPGQVGVVVYDESGERARACVNT